MKTKAVRLYGVMDLRTEEFELPEIAEDEILAKVVSDSLCMSTYKAALQGSNHRRVPADIAENPIIVGHEFAGVIMKVGAKWAGQFRPGDRFVLQPAYSYKGSLDNPGYSYPYVGGDATYVVIPRDVMECGCLLPYDGDAFFSGSLAEPMSCIIAAFHACWHSIPGTHDHAMGPHPRGKMALLAAAGPMGLGAIDYALHGTDTPPSLLVVTDLDEARLARAAKLFPPEKIAEQGTKLVFCDVSKVSDPVTALRALTGGDGYDDVFAYTPVRPVTEMADALLGRDGCLNFFAGPTDKQFTSSLNFYNVHYLSTHLVGTNGGTIDDMREAVRLAAAGRIDPAVMITHVGGLDAAAEATLNLPKIPGGKKLIYTHVSLPLTAIGDFAAKAADGGEHAALFADLARLCDAAGGLWNPAAERRLLELAAD